MASPVISVYQHISDQSQNDNPCTSVSLGVVMANKESSVITLDIWNNRYGSDQVSDLRDANVTVLDLNNTATSDLVVDKWVEVQCLNANDTSYTKIGGAVTKLLIPNGSSNVTNNTLSGLSNDGSYSSTSNNVCTLRVKVKVPINAEARSRDFKLRISGYYV